MHPHTLDRECVVVSKSTLVLLPMRQNRLVVYCCAGDISTQEQSSIVDGQVRWQWPHCCHYQLSTQLSRCMRRVECNTGKTECVRS